MAKETFQRTKPHVNVGTIGAASRTGASAHQVRRLQQLGLSALGAQQLISGQMITDQADRLRLAEFMDLAFLSLAIQRSST